MGRKRNPHKPPARGGGTPTPRRLYDEPMRLFGVTVQRPGQSDAEFEEANRMFRFQSLGRPPEELPDEGKELWRSIVTEIDAAGIGKLADRYGMEALVRAILTFRRAHRELDAADGLMTKGAKSSVRHPLIGVGTEASREIRSWCSEFGLTPSSLARITGTALGAEEDDDSDNPFADGGMRAV